MNVPKIESGLIQMIGMASNWESPFVTSGLSRIPASALVIKKAPVCAVITPILCNLGAVFKQPSYD